MADRGEPSRVLNRGALEAAVARPKAVAFGQPAFPSPPEKAAALLHGLVTSHPFVDGNKRAALGALLAFARFNGLRWPADEAALYELVMGVAAGELREVGAIAARIQALFGAGPGATNA